MTDLILTTAAAPPVITALVAAIGQALPLLPRRLYPVVAIALGIGWTVAIAAATNDVVWRAIIDGTIVGLAASGLYSGALRPFDLRIRRPDGYTEVETPPVPSNAIDRIHR